MAIAEAPKAIRRSPGTRANNHVVSQLPKPADRPELIGALPVNNHSNTLSIGSTERVFMGHCARRMIVAIVLSRVPATAAAQTYLNKLMRILVPNAASGAVDALSRTIAQALAKIWGWQPVVDNRPGAGGISGRIEFANTFACLDSPPR